jgi:DNA mismatch repair protein MutS
MTSTPRTQPDASGDTPLMQQWRDVKARNRDALIFFRVGDFYELFYQDAEEGSKLLGLTLTSRNNGAAARVPLAGLPVKAVDEYLAKAVRLGRRVAICEQVEDPSEAKGIVRREVVETITPGTVLHDSLLVAGRNNFMAALAPAEGWKEQAPDQRRFGLAALDLSTGELSVQEVAGHEVEDELGRLEAAELLLPRSLGEGADGDLSAGLGLTPSEQDPPPQAASTLREDWIFDLSTARDELEGRYGVQSLEGFGFETEDSLLIRAAGALVHYVGQIQPSGVSHLRPPRILRPGASMALDEMTRRNLELVDSLRPGVAGGTLLAVLDRTVTAMGARLLRQWILRPLVEPEAIWGRQEAVAELVEDPGLRAGLRDRLRQVTDLARLAGKVGAGRVTPRDLRGLVRSLEALPRVKEVLADADSEAIAATVGGLDVMEDVRNLVDAALSPDAPATLQEGGVIREGFSEELDELRGIRDGAVDFIASLQARERERTGIGSLKVGFNKVFGYYLEITRANLERAPEEYVRKQTLANAERFFTPELKEWEEKVFGAEDRIAALESELFIDLRRRIAGEVGRVQDAAHRVAELDVISTLAEVAVAQGYVRPEVHTGFECSIRAGRHPVVETMMPREQFIPNDVELGDDGHIVILTGPNMAGKSTVLRQVGLIQLLAQMGGFVPADLARLPVCDRIFTRVGASDNLARGQSTFMVEMNETAAIIHGATERSLVLLDEIGRGTSTYDGVSIAWSVTEHIHERIGAKTIFATHYHELTQLGDLLPGVKNMNVVVRESGEDIVFLRRLESGGADRSYGIQVARLAGLPEGIVARARELLAELEGTHSHGGEGLGRRGALRPESEPPPDQLTFFSGDHPVVERLREMDPLDTTPLEALRLLVELKRLAEDQ